MSNIPECYRKAFRDVFLPLLRDRAGVVTAWESVDTAEIVNLWAMITNEETQLHGEDLTVVMKLVWPLLSFAHRLKDAAWVSRSIIAYPVGAIPLRRRPCSPYPNISMTWASQCLKNVQHTLIGFSELTTRNAHSITWNVKREKCPLYVLRLLLVEQILH